MSDLEQELRATLARHAPGTGDIRAPQWAGAPAPTRRTSGGARVFGAAVLAAVLAVAVVAGVASVVGGSSDSASPASVLPTPTDPSPVPEGMRAVSYRGVEVLVPEHMTTSPNCFGHQVELEGDLPSPGTHGAVIVGPKAPAAVCAAVIGGVIDSPLVTLLPDDVGEGTDPAALHRTPVDVDGVRALSSCADCAPGEFDDGGSLWFPEQGVVVTATVYGTGFTQQILETARVVDVDSLGCPTRAEALGTPTARADDVPLWTGEAIRVTACLYRHGRSEGSGTVADAAARSSAGLLAVARPALPSGAPCVPVEQFDVAGVRVELADGRTVAYAIEPQGCDPRVVVDDGSGLRTAAPDGREIELLTALRGRS